MVCVSFQDASAYAEWLSARTGQRYRLPSDAEWHFLASSEAWSKGFWSAKGAEAVCKIGNGADLSALPSNPEWQHVGCDDGFAETSPVGRFAPGPWGLHDLNGNVWEWVATCAPEPTPDAVFPPSSCPAGAPACCAAAPGRMRPDCANLIPASSAPRLCAIRSPVSVWCVCPDQARHAIRRKNEQRDGLPLP